MKKKGTKNLTFTQRLQIETLNNAKLAKKDIAIQVGINLRTLYYELKRGEYKHKRKVCDFWNGDKYVIELRYSAQIAEDKYKIACSSRGRPIKIGKDYEFVNYIENRVKREQISACAVLGQIKRNKMPFKTMISKTTLYRYIEIGVFDNIKIVKRKQAYRRVITKRAPKGISIEKRPYEINARNTFGHWEMDTVYGKSLTSLLVLSERLTRQEIIFKIPNRKSDSVIRCLNNLERKFGLKFKKIFKTITVDNGSEFVDYKAMERSLFGKNKRTNIYYCHPYCSCERGTNERLNREIRRLIPKSSDLSVYSNKQIKEVENWVNNYPRQVLDFATSNEMFEMQMQLLA